MVLEAAIGLGGQLLSGALGSRSRRKAAERRARAIKGATGVQSSAAKSAASGLQSAFGDYQSGLDPYAEFGSQALTPLGSTLGGADSVRQQRLGGSDIYRQGVQQAQGYDPNAFKGAFYGGDTARTRSIAGPGNPILANALQDAGSYDPASEYTADIYNNPLLKGSIDETQRRLLGSQAARGRLGSGSTASGLQKAISDQAINFAGVLGNAKRAGIQDRLGAGRSVEGLRQQDLANIGQYQDLLGSDVGRKIGIGQGLEGIRQGDIANRFNQLGIGLNTSQNILGTGLNVAGDVGNINRERADILASGILGKAQTDNQKRAARTAFQTDALSSIGGALGGSGMGILSSFGKGLQRG